MENWGLVLIFLVLLIAMAVFCGVYVHRAEVEKQRMIQATTAEKTEFLAQVSNDIKMPMNVIVGMTALGMEEIEHPEKIQECLEKIHLASDFLLETLGELVDVSKIETGCFKLHPRAFALSEFQERVRERMVKLCREKKITFRMEMGELNLNLMVDPMRFEQLFSSLLGNAVKYTQESGEIVFRICNYATHNNVFSADYMVEDNGIGMSKEFQKLLFEPFTQEIRNVAEQQNGSGLGLAIARNIVDLMGGTIEVKSELNQGTKVKVHLDIELAYIQPENENQIELERQRQILAGKRILMVEDHPMNIEVSRKLLQSQGVKIVCAGNGREALELFSKAGAHAFDLILMDIWMPLVNGCVAARSIRKVKQADAQTIPIIAMSANDTQEAVNACKEAGMNAHIAKPVEPKKLYQILCEYLENPV